MPVTRFDKELVDVVPNGDGTYTISYLLTVERYGTDGVYDLQDDLRLGDPVTVVDLTVANVTPGGVVTNPAFDGEADTLVADDVPIVAGQTHTYTLTSWSRSMSATVTTENANCTLTGTETGTGAMNEAAVEIDDTTFEDTACQPFPAIAVDKEVTDGPTPLGGGQYQVVYTVTATNTGPRRGPTTSMTPDLRGRDHRRLTPSCQPHTRGHRATRHGTGPPTRSWSPGRPSPPRPPAGRRSTPTS